MTMNLVPIIPPKLLEDLRKFHNMPPYNEGCNYVAWDGYFAGSIRERFTLKQINAALAQLGKPAWTE